MSLIDHKYVDVLDDILKYGYHYDDPNRKGVRRKQLEYVNIKHLVEYGYPIITARKTYFKGAVGELLLFMKGSTDIRDYWQYGITFWNQDYKRYHDYSEVEFDRVYRLRDGRVSKKAYSMGKIYGHQYKKQYHVFDNFKKNKFRTDLVVDSWQVDDLNDMCLKPCHMSYMLLGSPEGFAISWVQRSTDFMLGTPINIQFYYLMGMLLEEWSGHKFLGVFGNLHNVHLYDNQIELAERMVSLNPELFHVGAKVKLDIDDKYKELPFAEFIQKVTPDNFNLENYKYVLNESVPMLSYNS